MHKETYDSYLKFDVGYMQQFSMNQKWDMCENDKRWMAISWRNNDTTGPMSTFENYWAKESVSVTFGDRMVIQLFRNFVIVLVLLIDYLLLFSLANIAERRVWPYVCVSYKKVSKAYTVISLVNLPCITARTMLRKFY